MNTASIRRIAVWGAVARDRIRSRVRRSHTAYQVKVGIVGSEPSIWRRLSLPGDTPLDELHHILQISFGWEG
ncbi:IS1096 element passenger TnpR family protein [Saccharopolyspora pogona]|uniref:IS1096 element passenger TnpR family protein n=1 Tax=Saccharopolyspora pogona TaxID=333966 RepID=UPI001689A39C|nr:hypothetical protein [Saccharopolyspora pogona]